MTPSKKGCREKGHRGELATVHELQAALGSRFLVRRGRQDRSGRDEPDVVIEGPLDPPVWIEVKTWGQRHPWSDHVAALNQAADAASASATPQAIPIAVIRENRREARAILRLAHLEQLVHRPPWAESPAGPVVETTWASVLVYLARAVDMEANRG